MTCPNGFQSHVICSCRESFASALRTLSPTQRMVVDRVAIGLQPQTFNPRTLGKLVRLGLIEETVVVDGAFRWKQYHMPIAVHIAWAELASQEFDALSPEERAAAEATNV